MRLTYLWDRFCANVSRQALTVDECGGVRLLA